MPSPRKRRVERAQIGAKVLVPLGRTQVASGDIYNNSSLENLQNIALYGSGGISPVFSDGYSVVLSDAISNADGMWSYVSGDSGYATGETGFGVVANTSHYYFPNYSSNSLRTDLSSSNPPYTGILIYGPDGPRSKYVPLYQGGAAVTASIKFGTGSVNGGDPPYDVLYFYFLGSGSTGDRYEIRQASNGALFSVSGASPVFGITANGSTASIAEINQNNGKKIFQILTSSIKSAGGFFVVYSSSASTSTTPVPGTAVYIAGGYAV